MQLDPDELIVLGRGHFEQGYIEKALLKVKAALSQPEPPAGAHALAARIDARLRQFDRSIGLLQHTLKEVPDSIERQRELAMAYQDSGDADKALQHCSAMLERHPLLPPALFTLPGCLRSASGWPRQTGTSTSCCIPRPRTIST